LVYDVTERIPIGRVTTYKEIAMAIGHPKSARAVGNALNRNPYSSRVPCHRVIRSNMSVGGFARGDKAKEVLLKSEGVRIEKGKVIGEIFRSIVDLD
jgi:O-6-methylguanine DNA methyltransferase